MAQNSHSPWNVVWLMIWAIIGFASWGAISHGHNQQRGFVNSKHGAEIAAIKKQHAEELSLKEQDLRAKSRETAARRQQKLEKSLGGPVQAAFKNPDYSLREALHRAALACAPTDANVRVDVDRFTEFTVTYSSDQHIPGNQMIAIARDLLPVAQKYLDAVRFSVKGSITAELDRQDIEYSEDWTRVPNDRIASLLAREIPVDTTQDRAGIEQFKREREVSEVLSADPALYPKAREAERQFQDFVKEGFEDLNAALALCEKATSLADVKKPGDLDARQKELSDASARAKKAKAFWADPGRPWKDALAAQGISGDVLEKLQKNFGMLLRHDPAKSAKVFEALEGRIESSRYFLKLAGEQFGQWQFNAEFGQYGFTTEEVSRRFNRARDQVIADGQSLESALRAWNE